MTSVPDDDPDRGAAPDPGGNGPSDEMASYRQVFVDETREELDALVDALLALEDRPGDAAVLDGAFRLVHSMKGSAGIMGFRHVAELAHRWEDVLDRFRSGRGRLRRAHVETMLRCVDALRAFVEDLAADPTVRDLAADESSALLARFDRLDAEESGVPTPGPMQRPAAAAPAGPGGDAIGGSDVRTTYVLNAFRVRIALDPRMQLPDLKARLIVARLAGIGDVASVAPAPEDVEAIESLRAFEAVVLTRGSEADLCRAVAVEGVVSVAVDPTSIPGAGPPSVPLDPLGAAEAVGDFESQSPPDSLATTRTDLAPQATEAPRAAADAPQAAVAAEPDEPLDGEESLAASEAASLPGTASDTVRVETARLDRLMNLTGELVVNRERIRQLVSSIAPAFRRRRRIGATNGTDPQSAVDGQAREELAGRVRQLADAVDQLNRVSEDLQRAVMETRMVPLAPLFNRFKRVVRDLSADTGKKIRLRIRGEKTELDKRMIDELADPLVHLVRNAIDHGLELPADRVARGKSETGTISLEAAHRGNSVYIEVKDDGRGLDVERIRRKIVAKGLASTDEAALLSDRQVVDHIWQPGFSTAEAVTDISGRGVGMDVVRSRIGALNGVVDARYEPGLGTTFAIRLPLTLAIVPSLLMRIRDGVFSAPLEEVDGIVRVAPAKVVAVHGRRAVDVRGTFVPIVRLDEVFRWPQTAAEDRRSAADESIRSEGTAEKDVVLLDVAGRMLGIEIDAPVGVSELVIKSLSENFRDVPGLSGASILGDGRVSLMLDTVAILEGVRTRTGRKESS